MSKIILDSSGYNEYIKEIEEIKKKIEKNNCDITTFQSDDAYGDGWHDNFAYEQARKKEENLFYELELKLNGLNNIEIVEESFNNDFVNLNSIIVLKFDDTEEIETYILTGNTKLKYINDIIAITLNSPLGSSIYHKKKNYRFEYIVNEVSISGLILDIREMK